MPCVQRLSRGVLHGLLVLLPSSFRSVAAGDPFEAKPKLGDTSHYDLWRSARLNVMRRTMHLGNMTVLEAGGGHCWFSVQLSQVSGVRAVCSEGRQEHRDWVRQHHPSLVVRADDWERIDASTLPAFDVLIHFGLLYHLRDPEASLGAALRTGARVVFLETEVTDSHDAHLACSRTEEGDDKALHGVGTRPSPAFVERVLSAHGFAWVRLDDAALNSRSDLYDWAIQGTGLFAIGLRKFWLAWRRDDQLGLSLLRRVDTDAWAYGGPYGSHGIGEVWNATSRTSAGHALRRFVKPPAGAPNCTWCGSAQHMLSKPGCSYAAKTTGFVWQPTHVK